MMLEWWAFILNESSFMNNDKTRNNYHNFHNFFSVLKFSELLQSNIINIA